MDKSTTYNIYTQESIYNIQNGDKKHKLSRKREMNGQLKPRWMLQNPNYREEGFFLRV